MAKPPFSGSIEFKIAFRAFDEGVSRKAQVIYTYAQDVLEDSPLAPLRRRRGRSLALDTDVFALESAIVSVKAPEACPMAAKYPDPEEVLLIPQWLPKGPAPKF